jgi:hypothetical protein
MQCKETTFVKAKCLQEEKWVREYVDVEMRKQEIVTMD